MGIFTKDGTVYQELEGGTGRPILSIGTLEANPDLGMAGPHLIEQALKFLDVPAKRHDLLYSVVSRGQNRQHYPWDVEHAMGAKGAPLVSVFRALWIDGHAFLLIGSGQYVCVQVVD